MQTRRDLLLPSLSVIAFIALILPACASEAWYEGMKRSAESQCRQQPPAELQACLDRVNKKSYARYEKERASIE